MSTIVVAVFGQLSTNQLFVGRAKRSLDSMDYANVEIVFAFAGEHWKTLPSVQTISQSLKNATCIFLGEDALPAELYNAGAKLARSKHLMFLSPDLPCDREQICMLLNHCSKAQESHDILAVADETAIKRYRLPHQPNDSLAHGWLVNAPVFDLSNVCVPTDIFHSAGGFDESPILQQECGWDLLIRLTDKCQTNVIGAVASNNYSDTSANFPRPFPVSRDIRRRYMGRSFAADRERRFLADLPEREADYLSRHIPHIEVPKHDGSPLRITITGSFWEHHHNWLCFLNYLRHLEGRGIATHRSLFDHLVERHDIEDSDLVILSRCKVDEVRQILNWCNDLKVPSIYMIDDNWLTVAKDWPDPYRDIFSPGKPYFDNFMYGARNADCVLTYNKLMQEDLAPIARKIISLPNSVDLDSFERTPRRVSGRFLIGYSGSPRYSGAPFRALAQIAKSNPDVDILLFGILKPEHEKELDGCNVLRVPQTSYGRYAEVIRSSSPDILLAPMDNSRTSRSKCPNKYLEITASGAVGIYSKVEPYTWCINDGVNGLFVEDSENVNEWVAAINLILDKRILKDIHSAARENIANNYTVSKVAPEFAKLIQSMSLRDSTC